MKRFRIILAAALAFALSAILAWMTAAPSHIASSLDRSATRGSRQRGLAAMDPIADSSAAVLTLVRVLLLDVAPPAEHYDSEGMEKAIAEDKRSNGGVGGGEAAIRYACDWANESPQDIFTWLTQRGPVPTLVPQSDDRGFLAYVVFERWAEKDLEAALAAAGATSNKQIRRQALLTTLEVMCKGDPSRARDLMIQNLALFDPDTPDPIFNASESGKSTCDMLLSLPTGSTRAHLLSSILQSMAGYGSDDAVAAQALAVWNNAPDALRRELVAAGFAGSVKKPGNYEGLEDLMRERAETSGNAAAAEAFIEAEGQAWAKRNLSEALEWAQTYLKGRSRIDCGAELFKGAAEVDFDSALRVWQTLPDSILKARAAGAIRRGAPEARKADAAALLESLSEHQRKLAR